MLLPPLSDENPRRKKILTSPRQHHQTNVRVKPEPPETKDSFDKLPKKNFLKSSSNNARIDTRTPKTSKKSSTFPPVSGPSALALSSNIKTNKNSRKKTPHSEIENCAEKKTSVEDVPEKIIHVIEPRDENIAQESYNCTEFTTLTSNENQNSNREKKATRGLSIIISDDAKDIATKKLKFRRGKVLEDKLAHNKKNDDEMSILRH
ncbi:UDP-glucose:glycoprotein glucosyltransferases [Striga asiatica]|uniref:UDP-glucose:glycoprotein glucosyltransferases n=1 Tax=Striga asiatica TaxID=4170 RepID=A0A5A7R737_STRAF|nr:UDP-glucose:glycoprotein glucosyltransferases [Striga asiatica]